MGLYILLENLVRSHWLCVCVCVCVCMYVRTYDIHIIYGDILNTHAFPVL